MTRGTERQYGTAIAPQAFFMDVEQHDDETPQEVAAITAGGAPPPPPTEAAVRRSDNTAKSPLPPTLPTTTVDLPLLALQDACREMRDNSNNDHHADNINNRRAPVPSDTPLFASILRNVLLQEEGSPAERAARAAAGWRHQQQRLQDNQVFRVLTRLLSADEVLAGTLTTPSSATDTSYTSTSGNRHVLGPFGTAPVDAAEAGAVLAMATPSRGLTVAGGDGQEEIDKDAEQLKGLLAQAPRRVCQYAFLKNDIVWICKACQADETCVLCNDCFRSSDHEGHEVYFYHAQVCFTMIVSY